MLGHSSITITLDIYSHVLPDMQEKAVNAMEDILGWRAKPEPFASGSETRESPCLGARVLTTFVTIIKLTL